MIARGMPLALQSTAPPLLRGANDEAKPCVRLFSGTPSWLQSKENTPAASSLTIDVEAPARVSILSERRAKAPFGLSGGHPGKPGENLKNGQPVGAKVELDVQPGDRITIKTPGGGGYGECPR